MLRAILVAPVTRTVRGIPSEVPLGAEQGLSVDCAATMDGILAFPKSMLTRRLGALAPGARWRMCDALHAATDG